jgi:hypothetical protein
VQFLVGNDDLQRAFSSLERSVVSPVSENYHSIRIARVKLRESEHCLITIGSFDQEVSGQGFTSQFLSKLHARLTQDFTESHPVVLVFFSVVIFSAYGQPRKLRKIGQAEFERTFDFTTNGQHDVGGARNLIRSPPERSGNVECYYQANSETNATNRKHRDNLLADNFVPANLRVTAVKLRRRLLHSIGSTTTAVP